MTFGEHIEELRSRLVFCVIAVVVAFIGCFWFRDFFVDLVLNPYESLREKMAEKIAAQIAAGETASKPMNPLVFIGPTEGFIFYIKVCVFASVVIAGPVILSQMWRFIGAGLYDKERHSVMRILPVSLLLFLMGMFFGYKVLLPIGMDFLIHFVDGEKLEASITVSKYFTLFSMFILVMGFIFQTPLIMVVTTSVDLTSAAFFSSKRKFFVVGAFIMAALFTPPDWVTQCLLAGPLIVLFEVGIILSRGVEKRRAKKEAAEAG